MKKISDFFIHVWMYVINYVMKVPLIIWLLLFNVRFKNIRVLYKTSRPYLVLPNHVNQWDPFLLSFPLPAPIRWMASDAAFRNGVKWILYAFGAIPKVKGQSDMVSLQHLKSAMAMKELGGIFPEGNQNWDGRTGELFSATAKLVRYMKVPVIIPLVKGGYLTKPRWSWKMRRCRIEIHFQRIIDFDEIQFMKLAEIEQRIEDALDHDEYAWQKNAMVPIRSERRAENLELAHWACPFCEGIGTFVSKGNRMSCSCGYLVQVDRFGFLQYPESGPSFAHPADWIKWQKNLLMNLFRDIFDDASEKDPVLLRDPCVTLMKGERAMPMLPVCYGEARLYRDRIEVGDGEDTVDFPLKEITAVNTFKQQKFEFRFEKTQYRFRFPSRHDSGFKWETAFKVLRNILVDQGKW